MLQQHVKNVKDLMLTLTKDAERWSSQLDEIVTEGTNFIIDFNKAFDSLKEKEASIGSCNEYGIETQCIELELDKLKSLKEELISQCQSLLARGHEHKERYLRLNEAVPDVVLGRVDQLNNFRIEFEV